MVITNHLNFVEIHWLSYPSSAEDPSDVHECYILKSYINMQDPISYF